MKAIRILIITKRKSLIILPILISITNTKSILTIKEARLTNI